LGPFNVVDKFWQFSTQKLAFRQICLNTLVIKANYLYTR
jgi:hypothetical protein